MLTHVLITQCASTSQSKTASVTVARADRILRHLIFHMHEEGINMMVGGFTIHEVGGITIHEVGGITIYDGRGHYHT